MNDSNIMVEGNKKLKGRESLDKAAVGRELALIVGMENVKIDELMKSHTTFKVGGPADIMVLPKDAFQLSEVLKYCNRNNLPVFVMGNGSNLIVSDKGIRGVVIKLYDKMNKCTVSGETIIAETGALLSRIANLAHENSLSGFEFASGIPGTLGGAIAMNAGAYGGEIKDVVKSTNYMDLLGNTGMIEGDDHQFGYRTSLLQREGYIVTSAQIKLKKGSPEEIKDLMDEFTRRRKEKQPLALPSAGSVFKRPEGYFAGKLIEDCGLRGCQIGGAQVSELHCGFIVNKGNATAYDIYELIQHIKKKVKQQFNVDLQTEVKIVGEE